MLIIWNIIVSNKSNKKVTWNKIFQIMCFYIILTFFILFFSVIAITNQNLWQPSYF